MVRTSKGLKKSAFTLIELIFAIVVIAISIVSLPMMTQVTSKAIEGNLAQEAIFSAVAEINVATTYTWDENSLLDLDSNASVDELSRVINNAGQCTDSGFDDSNNDDIMRRTGHVNRRCLNNLASTFYGATSFVDSLEASEHVYILTVEGSAATTSATGYKKEYESRLDVERCDSGNCVDFGTANNINMKEIEVTIRDRTTTNEVTTLRAYSANIGEVAYHKRIL